MGANKDKRKARKTGKTRKRTTDNKNVNIMRLEHAQWSESE